MAIGVAALGLFGFLFVRSLEDTRTAPYAVEPRHLQGWALSLEPAVAPNDPLLVLRPPPELAGDLFRQIFSRTMESWNMSTVPAIPLVLRGEFDRVASDRLTQDVLIETARAAGAEGALGPHCLVFRRISEPGRTRQAYFVFFDAPAISALRRQIGLEADVLSPVLFVAGADADFNSWLPLRVNPDADCLAPIEVVD
jgi:hypothetical protein